MVLGEIQGFIKVISIHGLGTMMVCTAFHGNPSNCCLATSIWTNLVGQLAT